jgi:hypothetical protein
MAGPISNLQVAIPLPSDNPQLSLTTFCILPCLPSLVSPILHGGYATLSCTFSSWLRCVISLLFLVQGWLGESLSPSSLIPSSGLPKSPASVCPAQPLAADKLIYQSKQLRVGSFSFLCVDVLTLMQSI